LSIFHECSEDGHMESLCSAVFLVYSSVVNVNMTLMNMAFVFMNNTY